MVFELNFYKYLINLKVFYDIATEKYLRTKEMADLKLLRQTATNFSILYAEDNEPLRNKAAKLLTKIFKNVYLAEDGQKGLEIFKKYKPQIVLSDIKMPHIDGLELAKEIRLISSDFKFIVMSAFDDKEHLYNAINAGVYRFLKKPVNISELSDTLLDALLDLKHEMNIKLFHTHLQNVFNYQSSMVLMVNGTKPILANEMFLEFFDYKNVENLKQNFENFSTKFLEHSGFLCNQEGLEWINTLQGNNAKLFHIKLKDKENELRHFILKYQAIPEKNGYGILSFDDITELNLLKLFDAKESEDEAEDMQAIKNLLQVIKDNSAKITMHNYYKGLSVTNDAIISKVKDSSVIVKTSYLQQKAIKLEKKTLIVAKALPRVLELNKVLDIDFDKQEVELASFKFIKTSPIDRKTVRVVPIGKQSVSVFVGENKLQGDIAIEDISIDAIKLSIDALPAGLVLGTEVYLEIVLELNKQPLIIKTKAKMYRKQESKSNFSIVFIFDESKKGDLLKYIAKCQMAIIREFKGL